MVNHEWRKEWTGNFAACSWNAPKISAIADAGNLIIVRDLNSDGHTPLGQSKARWKAFLNHATQITCQQSSRSAERDVLVRLDLWTT